MCSAQRPQEAPITITLAGQSMIRSDLRATAPAAVPVIQGLLKGDVVFTNFEAAVAEKGETVHEGRGFLAPPEALDALATLGFNLLSLSDNHAFDVKVTGIQNTIREADSRKIVHAGTGNNVAEAAAPVYLHTPKGTVALIASASGLIAPGGSATADGPGVNELRIEAGDQENEATLDLPGAPENTPNHEDSRRILQSIRGARQHADLVIVYQHKHVFGNHSFATIFTEGMQERLAPNDWLRRWTHAEVDAGADIVVMHGAPLLHGVETLSRPAHLLRSGQLHLQRAARVDGDQRTDDLGERGRVRAISGEELAVDFVPTDYFELRGRGPARYS